MIILCFLSFVYQLFSLYWLVGNPLLPADTLGYADHIRPDTMGILPASEMGRCMGKVDDTLSDRPFLWSDAILRKFQKLSNSL